MVRRKEVNGHKFELIALILALVATLWQASLGGWWDKQAPEWQYWIQEEVNFSVLRSIGKLVELENITDLKERDDKARELKLYTFNSVGDAIKMREDREKHKNGSAVILSNIGLVIYLLSALSFIYGKYLIYRSMKDNLPSS